MGAPLDNMFLHVWMWPFIAYGLFDMYRKNKHLWQRDKSADVNRQGRMDSAENSAPRINEED